MQIPAWNIRTTLMLGSLFAVLWWVLAEGRLTGAWLGGVAVAAALVAALRPGLRHEQGLPRLRLPAMLRFAGYFLTASLLGGWQVAQLAVRGRKALQPGIVDLPLGLPAGPARTLMIAMLGLMPGTLGVAAAGDRLRVHVLDQRQDIAAEVRVLERHVADLFGVAT